MRGRGRSGWRGGGRTHSEGALHLVDFTLRIFCCHTVGPEIGYLQTDIRGE